MNLAYHLLSRLLLKYASCTELVLVVLSMCEFIGSSVVCVLIESGLLITFVIGKERVFYFLLVKDLGATLM